MEGTRHPLRTLWGGGCGLRGSRVGGKDDEGKDG